MSQPQSVGFMCHWDPDKSTTWSQTPWNLLQSMRKLGPVQDIGLQVPTPIRLGLTVAYRRRSAGGAASMWRHSRLWETCSEPIWRRKVAGSNVDVVLEIQDLAVVDRPFFVLQDLSYDILLQHWDPVLGHIAHFPGLTRATIERRRDRQLALYERATGIIAMSTWLATELTRLSGVPAEKIHVVNPGATAALNAGTEIAQRPAPRRRLLFVGRDFYTKGGDVVVEAFNRLRRDADGDLQLTIAGPKSWPLPGEPPPGVSFLGRVPSGDVLTLMNEHDLLVMPSRFEGYGIVLAEALARGLPCVGRRAFAMTEIIGLVSDRTLVDSDDPDELARVIDQALRDDQLYADAKAASGRVAAHYTWDRAARQTAEVLATASS